ncbi:hypothetical protein MLD38_002872 [Melastoma candidum]|uniref:Uncharacterized protein n=1 Tax=Melastoma candidum TaxID=119954 RepID=A0ACB9S0W7_9MYRT|nr:hypothetical protein MLD38_002872 [Melastoma candidum]
MFRSWKSDKYKIKSVFRLEFQATQVPKSKKSGVSISLVPDDVGKPTLKLEKVPVTDGTCSWENPVFETVRLSRDPKTGVIKEKIYHFVVSTGSSKSGFLGEASIDFADFASENEPFTLSLPLKFANSGVILHVTIQRMQDNDQSEVEGNGVRCLTNQVSDISLDEDGFFDDEELNDGKQPASSGSEVSLSDSLNDIDGKPRREGSSEANENRLEKLTSEINSLRRQASLSEMELQSLRKQVVKETKRGQSLSDQITGLKEEKDALEQECQQLRSGKFARVDESRPRKPQIECEELRCELEEMRQELDRQKDLSSKLRLQLHKTHDSNSELVLAVRDLNEALKEKDVEISRLSTRKQSKEKPSDLSRRMSNRSMTEEEINGLLQLYNKDGVDPQEGVRLKQIVKNQKGEIEACLKRKEELETQLKQVTLDYEILKQENDEISSKLRVISLQKEMDEHAECSARVRELQTQIAKLEEVVQRQVEELSESSAYVNELEGQVKGLEKEMEKQSRDFKEEFSALTHAKVELEQRAVRAEESLRQTRWKNAVAAEKLQDEFKRLSTEMTTKFDENEQLTLEAVREAEELRQRNKDLEDMLHQANGDTQEIDHELSLKSIELERMQAELNKKSRQLEEVQAEAERLRKDSSNAREQEEQASMLVRQKEALKTKLLSAKKDADEALKELSAERSSKQKQMQEMEQLRSQLDCLVAQNDGFKNRISEEEAVTDKLREKMAELQKVIAAAEEERKLTRRDSTVVTSLQQKLASLKERAEFKGHESNGRADKRSIVDELEECIDWLKVMEVDQPSESPQKFKNSPAQDDVSRNSGGESRGEVEMLREKNRKMEEELKEMEERYSEVSLRFAMVESERERLVMTVRNLKNSKNK